MLIDRWDIPEPALPILRGLTPALSVDDAASGVVGKVRPGDKDDEGKMVAVMAGPHE